MSLKESYEQLRKKYNLPEYNDLNQDFFIEDLESNEKNELILQKIRIQITQKVEIFAKQIESMLQPETLEQLYEAHYIDEKKKNSAYSLFKKLMLIIRESNYASITNSEEENAAFINKNYKIWTSLKKELKEHISFLIKAWEKETDIKEDLNYFG